MPVRYRPLRFGFVGSADGDEPFPVSPRPVNAKAGDTVDGASTVTALGAGFGQARQWAIEALDFWITEANQNAYPLTPNTIHEFSTWDTWEWGRILRRTDANGNARWQGIERGSGPQLVQEFGPFDVLFKWGNPTPEQIAGTGTRHVAAYTQFDDEANAYIITMGLELHLDFGKKFYQEVVWHEMGHVVMGLMQESGGIDQVNGRIRKLFRSPLSEGAWAGRSVESFAETFKDVFFPARQNDNRTGSKIRNGDDLTRFFDLIQDLTTPQGPHKAWPQYAEFGESDDGLPFLRLDNPPTPAPTWDYNSRYAVPWDYPQRIKIELPFRGLAGVMWRWGGNGSFAGNGTRIYLRGEDDYKKPPPPGSKVTFRLRWEQPFGELLGKPLVDFAASEFPAGYVPGLTKPDLPIGVTSIDPGPVERVVNATAEDFFLGLPNGGIIWCLGRPGEQQWFDYVIPDELKFQTWQEYPDGSNPFASPAPELVARYEPIYFDFRQAGHWQMSFTVPPHDGEIAFQLLYQADSFVDANSTVQTRRWPIRTYYSGYYWSTMPRGAGFTPEVLPEGQVAIGNTPGGYRRR